MISDYLETLSTVSEGLELYSFAHSRTVSRPLTTSDARFMRNALVFRKHKNYRLNIAVDSLSKQAVC